MSKKDDNKKVKDWVKDPKHGFKAVYDNGHASSATCYHADGDFLFLAKGGDVYIYNKSGNEVGRFPKSDYVKGMNFSMDTKKTFKEAIDLYKKDNPDFSQQQKTTATPPPLNEVYEELDETKEGLNQVIEGKKADTETEKNYLEAFNDWLNRIYKVADLTGENPLDLAKRIYQSPDSPPEEFADLIEKYGLPEDEVYNALINRTAPIKYLGDLNEEIEDLQSDRRETLNKMEDASKKREASLATELGILTDETTGIDTYKKLYDLLTPEQRSQLTPSMLRRISYETDLNKMNRTSQEHGDVIDKQINRDLNLDLGPAPTMDEARDQWRSSKEDGYAYQWSKPYEQQASNVAAMGHSAGSSAFEGAQEKAGRYRDLEDLHGSQILHHQNLNTYQAKQNMAKTLGDLSDSYQKTFGEPLKIAEDILGRNTQAEFNQNYQQNVFNKDIAEGRMKLDTQEMNEASSLYNMLNQANDKEMQVMQGLRSQIYSLKMLLNQFSDEQLRNNVDFIKLKEELWRNRQVIVAEFDRIGNDKAAREIEHADKESNNWLKTIASLANVAGTIYAANKQSSSNQTSSVPQGDYFGSSSKAFGSGPEGTFSVGMKY